MKIIQIAPLLKTFWTILDYECTSRSTSTVFLCLNVGYLSQLSNSDYGAEKMTRIYESPLQINWPAVLEGGVAGTHPSWRANRGTQSPVWSKPVPLLPACNWPHTPHSPADQGKKHRLFKNNIFMFLLRNGKGNFCVLAASKCMALVILRFVMNLNTLIYTTEFQVRILIRIRILLFSLVFSRCLFFFFPFSLKR